MSSERISDYLYELEQLQKEELLFEAKQQTARARKQRERRVQRESRYRAELARWMHDFGTTTLTAPF